MKFAREFREALRRENYPPRWVDSAIPYGQLKKCLKKVQRELAELGLDADTLRQLLAAHATSEHGDSVPLASYELGAGLSSPLRPRLTVFIHLEDGEAVDATLTPASREFLQKLASGQVPIHHHHHHHHHHGTDSASTLGDSDASTPTRPLSPTSTARPSHSSDSDESLAESQQLAGGAAAAELTQQTERIEVPLTFDCEFFDLLQSDVWLLDALQEEEEAAISKQIASLGEQMGQLTRPARFHKTDLTRWREVFELYLDAQVFFSTCERDHGARPSAKALEQLVWFQREVNDRGLVQQFKLPASRDAYSRFLSLNSELLQNLKFQELNRIAVAKILKKFNKRTSLGVSGSFPQTISRRFLAESVAKDLCAQVSSQVVATVPRVDDYMCPVCLSIAYLPVRFKCRHVFCVRCVVKMQRECKQQCPMCRQNVVMLADLRNLDHELARYMDLYFKKEAKEKQKANDLERGIEMFGENYKPDSCAVM
ncbi:RING-14 protein [Magnaporthiopsis poae ATCC 64411]|uniref:RING-14 protein n=1 Tax=Magnaporthiopsis poae (strain ATCC 64411 / 73-15) TaxID=644358 RepID=A0A0C4DUJ5_MAGP6|nr:RING-14 protein [Magnaporthiopsis poae ATCC 64411]